MTVDPWGGFNRGYDQLMNVLAMKRQEERGNATNALASRKMKMEESKMSREAEAEKIQDAITLTQDMTGDGSPEDMAKFPQRRALYVQKWGESPNIPQNYDPQFIQSLKGLNRQEWKPTTKAEALELKGVSKKWEPQTKSEAIEFEQAKIKPKELSEKDKIIQKLRAEGNLTAEEEKIIAGAIKPPSTHVSVDVGPKAMTKLGEEMSKSLVTEYQEAQKSAQSLQELQTAKELLKNPMITGAGANTILSIGKGLQQLGFNFAAEPIANTEAFAAQMGKQVGQIIKAFGSGTGLSDADREYAEKIAGGKITLTKQSIEKIIDLNEKATRNIIANYNKKAAQAMKRPGGSSLPYDLIIQLPGESQRGKTAPAPGSTKKTTADVTKKMSEQEARKRLGMRKITGTEADKWIREYKEAGVVE